MLRKKALFAPHFFYRVVQLRRMFVFVCCLLVLNVQEDLSAIRACLGLFFVDSVPLSRAVRTGVTDRSP